MVDPITTRRWLQRALFFFLCGLVIFIKMLPLSTIPSSLPGPDILFILAAVWIMRRPRWVPVLLIVAIHLLADILFLRPLGLWPAISLLGYEFLRQKANGPTENPVIVEIGLAAMTFAAMIFVLGVVQLMFGIEQPSVGAYLLHILITIAAYPFVIAFAHFVIHVRRVRPGDFDVEEATS